MRQSAVWRRSSAAAAIYASAVVGFLGTVIAAHAFGARFGLYAVVIAAAGFFQILLDLTVEEALVKYGFRYQERADWGRLRRLFRVALALKLAGGILAAGGLLALAPLGHALFGHGGLALPLAIVAALPLVQAPENVAGVALILRGRYDIRSAFLLVSMVLRVASIAVGSQFGIWQTVLAIVVAQVVATAAVGAAGRAAFRRYPRVPAVPLGPDRRGIIRFALQSSAATGIVSLRSTLPTLLVAAVASPLQAGWFRAAQSPQQGFASLSAPARLVLLTEQTRDWERGSPQVVFRGIRRYTVGAALLMVVLVPPLVWFMPEIAKVVFSRANAGAADAARLIVVAGALQMVVGWSKTLPVSIGRPKLRIWTHGLETLILLPLVVVFAAPWGATGAGAAVLVSTAAFTAAWALLYARIRKEPVVPVPPADTIPEIAEVLVP